MALTRRDAFLVLNLCLDVLDAIGWFHLERDGLAGKGLYKDEWLAFKEEPLLI